MGRITVSLPDELGNQLDSYAKAQGKAVSQVVADAIRALLGTAGPSAVVRATPAEAVDPLARRYMEEMLGELRFMLATVRDLATCPEMEPLHEPPYDLPDPPWIPPQRRRASAVAIAVDRPAAKTGSPRGKATARKPGRKPIPQPAGRHSGKRGEKPGKKRPRA